MPDHRIAVVTPYYREPVEMLVQCHRSVVGQDVGQGLAAKGVAVDHILVADGHPLACIDDWSVAHVKLPRSHDDDGNTPRGVGGLLARSEGYDFIAYLDADNWFHDGHLRSLLQLWKETCSPACASLRTFHDDAGRKMVIQERDEDELRHVDTSCFLLHRSAFDSLSIWLDMPKILSSIGDRIFLAGLLHRKLGISSTQARTVAFRSKYRSHYLAADRPVPEGAKDGKALAPAIAYLTSAAGVSQCVAALGFWPLSYVQL